MKWVQINYTLHGVLHHSCQLIKLNDNCGLGSLSEEGLEANNKCIRRYLELLSRKSSPQEQLTDVMGRLLERSDPYVLNRQRKYRPQILCLTCGSVKHTTRLHEKVTTNLNSYDSLVNKILIDSL